MKVAYLACPYMHENPVIVAARVDLATQKAAELMMEGYNVYSPLTHSDPIAPFIPEKHQWDYDFWLSRDLQIIRRCVDELHVLCLDGWEESKGVGMELDEAEKLGIPIVLHAA